MNWRAMRPADLVAVERLSNDIHTAFPEDPAVFADRLRLAPETCFVLADAQIQGYLVAHPWAGPPPALNTVLGALPAADHLFLHDLALAPGVRGQGYGQAIVARLPGPVALIAVSGSAPYWQAQGFAPAPLAPGKLASYGPDALYMRR